MTAAALRTARLPKARRAADARQRPDAGLERRVQRPGRQRARSGEVDAWSPTAPAMATRAGVLHRPRPSNVHQENGNLVITAGREATSARTAVARAYTSARIETKGHFEQQYGRIEARIKLPAGQGIWPAFWMLGSRLRHVGWPACGEIDIMENIGYEPSKVHGTLHGPGYSGRQPAERPIHAARPCSLQRRLPPLCRRVGAWRDPLLRGRHALTRHRTRTTSLPARWVFDHPFFLLLNVAVGGQVAGQSGCDDGVSCEHAGGLRAGVPVRGCRTEDRGAAGVYSRP